MAQGDFYYCLEHRTVEPYEGCRAASRLGPYPDRASAEAALERVAERNESWDNDPAWHDDPTSGAERGDEDAD